MRALKVARHPFWIVFWDVRQRTLSRMRLLLTNRPSTACRLSAPTYQSAGHFSLAYFLNSMEMAVWYRKALVIKAMVFQGFRN